MRIIFMGTPDFAVASLEALIKAGENIVAVITAPDRPAGRGQRLAASPVKKFALDAGLTVLQPTNLKAPEFLKELEAYQADLQVVVAFRMLPKVVWVMPTKGTINLHASLLPQYRGAAPINWAIIRGETKTGATTFFINENIDTGDIIDQREVPISDEETAGSLHDKLMETGADLLVETIKNIADDNLNLKPQQAQFPVKGAPKIFKEDTRIDFNKDVKRVYDFVRGLSPYPAAHALLHNGDQQVPVKIYEASWRKEDTGQPPGTVATDGQKWLKVACENGWLELKSLQPAGKKRMNLTEWLNGNKLAEGAKML